MNTRLEQLLAFKEWRQKQAKDERWCVLINADPDALASALAFKRLMHSKTQAVDIARINEVTRPDNLAMIRYLRIPVRVWQPEKASSWDHFALVDSQPSHNPVFAQLKYDALIDHHPLTDLKGSLTETAFCCIRPGVGATSTMMSQFLQVMRVRPGPLLATALLYGIRTDTGAFERSGVEEDLRAYQWLSHHADNTLLRRVSRSEYLRSWLPFFSRAFRNLVDCPGAGAFTSLNEIPAADLLVSVADFFTKVHGLKWIAVSGLLGKTVIVVFRSDGSRDIGRFADACFYDVGTAGGHRNMGRAEFQSCMVPKGMKPAEFVLKRLLTRKLRPETRRQPAESHVGTVNPDNGSARENAAE